MVLFPKLSVIFISLSLIFARGYIINKVQILNIDHSKRLLPPDENLNFLKETMEMYCDVY